MRPTLSAIAAVTFLLSASTALATDYSDMAKPSYARLQLLSAKRTQQIECGGLALYFAESGRGVGKALGQALGEKVRRRLAADLGDEKTAAWFFELKAGNYTSPIYDEALKADIVKTMERQCAPLFQQAAKGDAALEAALGPVPSEPLRLPDTGQCLAVLTYDAERNILDAADMRKLMHEVWIDKAPKAGKATRKADLQKSIAVMQAAKPDDDQLYAMFAACFPTMKDVLAAEFAAHPDRKFR